MFLCICIQNLVDFGQLNKKLFKIDLTRPGKIFGKSTLSQLQLIYVKLTGSFNVYS